MTFSYDKNRLFDLVKNFYTLTKIKSVIFDTDFNPIISVPEKECVFCETLRKNPDFKTNCDNCLKNGALPCKNENRLNIYKCHAGLFEVTSPIRINGVLFGYFTIGQIIEENDRIYNRNEMMNYAAEFTEEDVKSLFDSISSLNYEQIKSAAEIMKTLVSYIIMSDIIKEGNGDIILGLNHYIENNISSDLSVDNICKEFKISRNALYKLSQNYFGMSIGKFVRKKKMETAANLIKNGKNVSDASEAVGFYDYNYFSKAFKAVMGVAPKNFKCKK